jgi:hypothetical protein
MLFETGEQRDWWRNGLFYFYPQLSKEYIDTLSFQQRKNYYIETLYQVYRDEESNWTEKVEKYNQYWDEYEVQIADALSETFDTDTYKYFNDIVGNITLNPVCPRDLSKRSFDVFWKNSEKGALGMALHEIIHFVWFDVWQKHFQDNKNEYEAPYLKWILSEMVVEPIMHDERLSNINPYFDRNKGGCVYDYFYTMNINGKPILETLLSMYKENSIIDFMEQGYSFCQRYETEIRTHIRLSENR